MFVCLIGLNSILPFALWYVILVKIGFIQFGLLCANIHHKPNPSSFETMPIGFPQKLEEGLSRHEPNAAPYRRYPSPVHHRTEGGGRNLDENQLKKIMI